MKLGSFFIALKTAESYVIRDEANTAYDVQPVKECISKIGNICVAQRITGYTKKPTSTISETLVSSDTPKEDKNKFEMSPLIGYMLTKDKDYLTLGVQGSDINGLSNPAVNYLAAQKAQDGDLAMSLAMSKNPLLPISDVLTQDGTIAVATAKNNNLKADPNGVAAATFLAGAQNPYTAFALSGSTIPAQGIAANSKNPLYYALGGNADMAAGYAALGGATWDKAGADPWLAYAVSGDPATLHAGLNNDAATRTRDYSAYLSGNPVMSYSMTGNLLAPAVQSNVKVNKSNNPVMNLYAAKQGVQAATALTGNANVAYAAEKYAADNNFDVTKNVLASQLGNPLLTKALTDDQNLVLSQVAESADADTKKFLGAMTKDPSMALAVSGDPASIYAASKDDPEKLSLAMATGNPAIAYAMTKDPTLMALTSDDPKVKQLGAALSGDKIMAGVVGGPAAVLAADTADPVRSMMIQQLDNPIAAYQLTNDERALFFNDKDNKLSAGVNAPLVAALTKDPLLTAATTGNVMAAYYADKPDPMKSMILNGSENPALAFAGSLRDAGATRSDAMIDAAIAGGNTDMAAAKILSKDAPVPLPGQPNLVPQFVLGATGNAHAALLADKSPDAISDEDVLLGSQSNNPALTLGLTGSNVLAAITDPEVKANPVLVGAHSKTDAMETFVATGDATAANLASVDFANPITVNDEINKAVLAGQMNSPLATYAITKDKDLMAIQMAENGDANANTIAFLTKDQANTYALTGDAKAAYIAKDLSTEPTSEQLKKFYAAETGNPAIAYAVTEDATLAALTAGPENVANDLGLTYLLSKDSNVQPHHAFALSGGNPATLIAGNQNDAADKLLTLSAAATGNPALAYGLTQDPTLAAVTSDRFKAVQKPHSTVGAVLAQTNPNLAYSFTGNSNYLLQSELAGNPSVALALGQNAPQLTAAQLASSAFLTPDQSYALYGNPLVYNVDQATQKQLGLASALGSPAVGYLVDPNKADATKSLNNVLASQSANPLAAAAAIQTNNPILQYGVTQHPYFLYNSLLN